MTPPDSNATRSSVPLTWPSTSPTRACAPARYIAMPSIAYRLARVAAREVAHQARRRQRREVRRVAALDRGRELRRELVAGGRVVDGHVGVGLGEAVEHGLEGLALGAGPYTLDGSDPSTGTTVSWTLTQVASRKNVSLSRSP